MSHADAMETRHLPDHIGVDPVEAAKVLIRENTRLEFFRPQEADAIELNGNGWFLRIEDGRLGACEVTATSVRFGHDEYKITVEPSGVNARGFDLRHLVEPSWVADDADCDPDEPDD